MGASAAYHLSRSGVTDVLLVEREPFLGMGSTGRNAGGFRHQFSTESNIRLSIESIKSFETFHEEVGYEIDIHQDGYLFLISSEQNVAAFKTNVELQQSMGVDVALLTPEDAIKLAPGLHTEGVLAATFCARDGIADPNGVTLGFAKAAQNFGVSIERNCEVLSISSNGSHFEVDTSNGPITAQRIVNAAGPYSRLIGQMAGLEIPVSPLKRHIFITDPIERHVPRSKIMVIDLETTFYFHREGPGILFGMSDHQESPGFDISVNWDLLERIIPIAQRRLPALSEASIAKAWAGLYEMTPDANPIIGEHEDLPGFFTIAGFSGHGFQHSPAAGRLLAQAIMASPEVSSEIAPYSPARFRKGLLSPESSVI